MTFQKMQNTWFRGIVWRDNVGLVSPLDLINWIVCILEGRLLWFLTDIVVLELVLIGSFDWGTYNWNLRYKRNETKKKRKTQLTADKKDVCCWTVFVWLCYKVNSLARLSMVFRLHDWLWLVNGLLYDYMAYCMTIWLVIWLWYIIGIHH